MMEIFKRFSFAPKQQKPITWRKAGIFTITKLPDGYEIVELDEDVHERALKAATETLRRQREKQTGKLHGSKTFASIKS